MPVNVPYHEDGVLWIILFFSFPYPFGTVDFITSLSAASTNLRFALIKAVPNLSICKFILFTAIQAGPDRKFEGVHYAGSKTGTQRVEKAMRVKFPGSFTDLKDAEV